MKALYSLFFMLVHLSLSAAGPVTPFVSNRIGALMKEEQIPGIAVALSIKGKGFLFCYGVASRNPRTLVTPNTLFDIASITKVFTTTDLALQIEKKRMFLKDPIVKYLPGIGKESGLSEATLLELATHTASLPRALPQHYSKEDIYAYLKYWNPPYAVGSKYEYSNLGFWLLRFAIENVENRPYQQILDDELFKPLNMTSTMVFVPQEQRFRYAEGYISDGEPIGAKRFQIGLGGGSLKSTASDMLRFLQVNLSNAASSQLFEAMKIAQEGYFKVHDRLTMGLAWQRFCDGGLLIIDKNGGVDGFSSYIGMVPEKKIGIVILANKGKAHLTTFGREILVQLSR